MSTPQGNGVSPGNAGARANASPRVIAMMNQKGGVGKTTTTVNLGAAFAEAGHRTLVVDLDPQAHATLHLGIDPATLGEGLADDATRSGYDLLMNPDADAAQAIRTVRERLSVLPAETDLAGIETQLAELDPAERSGRLRRVLQQLAGQFDIVLLDCPPSLGVLTLNALAAAGEVIIPMQAHFLALQGVSKLLETVSLVRQSVNPALQVAGVVVCMHDAQATHSKEVLADLASFLASASTDQHAPWRGARVFEPPIRRNIKLAECPSFGQTIFDYSPWCPGALDYRAVAKDILSVGRKSDTPKVTTLVGSKSPRPASAGS